MLLHNEKKNLIQKLQSSTIKFFLILISTTVLLFQDLSAVYTAFDRITELAVRPHHIYLKGKGNYDLLFTLLELIGKFLKTIYKIAIVLIKIMLKTITLSFKKNSEIR